MPSCSLTDGRALNLARAELAARRGLRTWPRGASWPAEVHPSHVHGDDAEAESAAADKDDDDEAARAASRKLAETQESALAQQTTRQSSTEGRSIPERESAVSFWPLGVG